jgi:Tol biopolymer transport system component
VLRELKKSVLSLSGALCVCLLANYAFGQTPQPSASATPAAPKPYVAYLHEGNLWAIRADGSGLRQIAIAPANEVIQDFLWSPDGKRCYFAVGLRFFDVSLATGNLASGGELTAAAGTTIERLELGNDGRSLIAHATDANNVAQVYAVTIGEREARPLSVDEYTMLAPASSRIVRRVGELSVSPDAQYVLFKEVVGAGEEVFVAEVETGRKWQVTNLNVLDGFEPSAEALGGRLLLEVTWSRDGRYILFNPAQSCSETGLCYGRLFLVDFLGNAQLQLSLDMMVSLPLEWDQQSNWLIYDDGSEIVLADTKGETRRLADGNHPKWQPLAE